MLNTIHKCQCPVSGSTTSVWRDNQHYWVCSKCKGVKSLSEKSNVRENYVYFNQKYTFSKDADKENVLSVTKAFKSLGYISVFLVYSDIKLSKGIVEILYKVPYEISEDFKEKILNLESFLWENSWPKSN